MNQNKFHRIGNTAGLAMICIVLLIAFADQLFQHDLPCPLCLLQRVSFIAVGLCLCMNLTNGIHTDHYGLMILAAILGFTTALRQVSLHLAPGDPGFGHLLLGFHLYIWCAITFIIIIGLAAIAMLLERGFTEKQQTPGRKTMALMGLFLVLILANGISTLIECGVLDCP